MKKRLILIIASILTAVLTFSLVIYTVVKTSQPAKTENPKSESTDAGKDNNVNNNTNNNTNVGTKPDGGDGEHYFDEQNCTYNVIVGDVINDEILARNFSTVRDELSPYIDDSLGEIQAVTTGSVSTFIIDGETKYNYDFNIYEVGNGTKTNPYNVVNAEGLLNLAKTHNTANDYYVLQDNLDLSGYASWMPIGTYSNPFVANIDGNGKTITGMNIELTPQNYTQYVQEVGNESIISLGFFGVTNNAEIKNISIQNAKINTSAIQNSTILTNLVVENNLTNAFVGTLVGIAQNGTVINGENTEVSSEINSSFANSSDYLTSSIAGLVGFAGNSKISNYTINTTITATQMGMVDTQNNTFGARVAGVVGVLNNSTLTNIQVTPTITIGNFKSSSANGAVYYVEGKSTVNAVTVSNAVIKAIQADATNTVCVKTSGFADTIKAQSSVLNSSVLDIQINQTEESVGIAESAGFAFNNLGTITNCSVASTTTRASKINGVNTAGFVYQNAGTITFSTNAVNATLSGQYNVAGLVKLNLAGAKVTGVEEKTNVNVKLMWSKVNSSFTSVSKANYMIAGLVVDNYGTVSNFSLIATMHDVVSAGGAIGFAYAGSTIENCNIDTNIRTLRVENNAKYSAQTTYVSGAIAVTQSGTGKITVKGLYVVTKVNDSTASWYSESHKYSMGCFGGLIACNNGATVEITDTKVGVAECNVDVYTGNLAPSRIVVDELVAKEINGTITYSNVKILVVSK